jgi:hypothetical protein
MTALILKRTSASRPSGEWNYGVLADGAAAGRIYEGARRARCRTASRP